jgi:hypothetical protein
VSNEAINCGENPAVVINEVGKLINCGKSNSIKTAQPAKAVHEVTNKTKLIYAVEIKRCGKLCVYCELCISITERGFESCDMCLTGYWLCDMCL